MHSRSASKDKVLFRQEIDAILNGTSNYHRPKDSFDFRGFIFPEADFYGVTFTRYAQFSYASFIQRALFYNTKFAQDADFRTARFHGHAYFSGAQFSQDARFHGATFIENGEFSGATFNQKANFRMARFNGNADFSGANFTDAVYFSVVTFAQIGNFYRAMFSQTADFRVATFSQRADFRRATLTQNADFALANFPQDAYFSGTVFGAIVDFTGARFGQPAGVRFYQVNKNSSQRLRVRFRNCNVEGVHFEDVNWHREGGRMVLQDELDIRAEESKDYELVAIAYRRLVSNFEKVRNYDDAEDCFIGAMEMKRLDPAQPRFVRLAVNLYRLASNYGSSYRRAFAVLAGFVFLVFPLGFALAGLEPRGTPWIEVSNPFLAGLQHSSEVATFQRDTAYVAANWVGRVVSMLETVFVPAQLALLLLALRRRFRR